MKGLIQKSLLFKKRQQCTELKKRCLWALETQMERIGTGKEPF